MSLYEILNCNKNSSAEEIKKEYKKLALKHHPDRNGGNDEMFKKINEAYTVLTDDQKRRIYDQTGQTNPQQGDRGGFPFGAGGFPFGDGFPFGGGGFNFNFSSQSSSNHQQAKSEKLEDIQLPITISLSEAYFGFSKIVSYPQPSQCECFTICSTCKGTGVITMIMRSPFGQQIMQKQCDQCHGHAKGSNPNCSKCSGSGKVITNKNIKISGQRGIEHGSIIKLPKGGMQPNNKSNDIHGDLVITVKIEDNPHLKREGINLIFNCDINWIDSICGKDITIPLFEDDYTINTSLFNIVLPNKIYTIAEKGMIDTKNGTTGNLHITFNIKTPSLTDDQRQKCKQSLQTILDSSL